jgi:hypothetical protein
MMLIATTAAFALVASTVIAAAPVAAATASIPPMSVNVSIAGVDVSPALVKRTLVETDAIWRSSGVTFVWQRAARLAAVVGDAGPFVPKALHVIIGSDRGAGRDGRRPLGWIVFDALDAPQQEIYLSYANAVTMMEEARGVVGIVKEMPAVQRETLVARAMGRALAHELGHYLLASKLHTQHGLMKATLTATDLFTPDISAFLIEPAQRRAVAARLTGGSLVASR